MNRAENKALNIFEYGEAMAEVNSFPQVIYIETTNACNLECPMCPITMGHPGYDYPVKFFPWDKMAALEPLLETAERCIMSGGGEPLLHPKFADMLEKVKKAGAETIFNTNGTLMTARIAAKLVQLQADAISFSVDGATEETYAKIRVGGNLETVATNLKRLIAIKKKEGSDKPYINLQMTLMDENRGEIGLMVEKAAEWGVGHLVIEPLTPVFSDDPEYSKFIDEHGVEAEQIADAIRAAREKARMFDLVFSSHYLTMLEETSRAEPRDFRCVQPWINMGFRSDGTVFPCCGTSHAMGRLDDSPPSSVWNNDEYKFLRSRFKSFDPPSYCDLCLTEGRAMRFNEDLLDGAVEKRREAT